MTCSFVSCKGVNFKELQFYLGQQWKLNNDK